MRSAELRGLDVFMYKDRTRPVWSHRGRRGLVRLTDGFVYRSGALLPLARLQLL